ncbi:MAG: PIN domain-containing protein [Alphaproteobacteria bacterium]|nr:PIN domain-containing protein [Alphaproteobacteria bacterium]
MVKVLLDTNIIIYRETNSILNPNTPNLFKWLDEKHYDKYFHPISKKEISSFGDTSTRDVILSKLSSYKELTVLAPIHKDIQSLIDNDTDINSVNDSKILNELYCEKVDLLITQDKKLLQKSKKLGISEKVFSVEGFSEKMLSEYPDLIDYNILSIRKEKFGNIDLSSHFFDSLKNSYEGFERWFKKKSEEDAYICYNDNDIGAFLYLKLEEDADVTINPVFLAKKRLKIGTLKVDVTGLKIGERFLKIAFENAINMHVDEIYVTIFDNNSTDIPKKILVDLLKSFGFERWGTKGTGGESVYVRKMDALINKDEPKKSFPFFSKSSDTYFCPIYPEYHTELFPDSILNNESPADFRENKPHRNAITKVYISRSYFKDVHKGNNIVFYRTKQKNTKALYTSVITTIGIVNNVYFPETFEKFKEICKRRSIFNNDELITQWNYNYRNHPFIVEFLYLYSFPKPKVNLSQLINNGIVKDGGSAPRGFELITHQNFGKILRLARVNESFIVD